MMYEFSQKAKHYITISTRDDPLWVLYCVNVSMIDLAAKVSHVQSESCAEQVRRSHLNAKGCKDNKRHCSSVVVAGNTY